MKDKIKTALTDFSGDKFLPKLVLVLTFVLTSYTLYIGMTVDVDGDVFLGRAIWYVVIGLGLYSGLRKALQDN